MYSAYDALGSRMSHYRAQISPLKLVCLISMPQKYVCTPHRHQDVSHKKKTAKCQRKRGKEKNGYMHAKQGWQG